MRALTDEASLHAFAPEWVVFWADHVRVGQFAIWAPYLRRTRHRTLVLSSGDHAHDAVRTAVDELPRCAMAEPFSDVVAWLAASPGLVGFLYIGSHPANAEVIDRFPDAAHVWIGHGESAKKANRHRTASVFDAVFVADDDAVLRYGRAIRGWVRDGACSIGVPVVEGLTADPWTEPRPIRSILYAPTWEGRSDRGDYGSLPWAGPAVIGALPELLARGVEVIVRPHPSSGHRLRERRAVVDALLAAGARTEPDKAAAMSRADVLIGDVSGITSEFLFTRKPVLLPVSADLTRIISTAALRREYSSAYHWDVRREPLLDRLATLEREDPLAGARERAAATAFRGHRTVDEAVETFDLALAAAALGRGRRRSIRSTFETARRQARRHA